MNSTTTTNPIKNAYWNLLRRYSRIVRPTDKVLSPHDWLDGIARHLPEHADRVVMVDGGAHDGLMAQRFRKRFPNLEVHAFEPNADLFPMLKRNLADIPGSCHNEALGDTSGTSRMFINNSPMTSSLLPRGEYGEKYFDDVTQLRETRQIQTTTLDQWFDKARGAGLTRVDILKLDLQGYEAQALRGAARLLKSGVRCVVTEVNFVPIYDGSALFGDIDTIMRGYGYRLFNLYNLATKQSDGQLNGGDALYIRDHEANNVTLTKAA